MKCGRSRSIGHFGQPAFRPPLGASTFILLLLTVVPAMASGQDTTVISDTPACVSCSLELEHVTTLSAPEDAPVYARSLLVETPSHYVLSHFYDRRTLLVFDREGAFVRSVGREGEGPGEYRDIAGLDIGGDSLFVFDGGLGRLTVLDTAYGVVATDSVGVLAFRDGFARLPSGDLVLNGVVPEPDRVGLPLHLARVGSGLRRSFGARAPSSGGGRPPRVRRITAADPGGFWSAHHVAYTIDRWDEAEELRVVLRRTAPWFERERYDPAIVRRDLEAQSTYVYSRVMDVVEDDAGMLRVLLQVPDPDADPAMAEQVGGIFPLYDSVIEIIDPVEGEVISRTKFSPFLVGFLGPEQVYSVPDDDSNGRIDVWRLQS